jgi:hypothetical protein
MPAVPQEAYDRLLGERNQLAARLAEAEAECDQWQRKLTEDAWPELARLREQVQVLTLANQTFTGTFVEIARLHRELARLRAIEQAARNLDARRNEGYATLVSYLIRLHEALDVDVAQQHQDEQHDQD